MGSSYTNGFMSIYLILHNLNCQRKGYLFIHIELSIGSVYNPEKVVSFSSITAIYFLLLSVDSFSLIANLKRFKNSNIKFSFFFLTFFILKDKEFCLLRHVLCCINTKHERQDLRSSGALNILNL